MNTPPPLPNPAEDLASLLAYKKRWNRIETGLRKLRDDYRIQGRIPEREKAQMILRIEAGEDLYSVIAQNYPQYLISVKPPPVQKKGCFGLLILGAMITGLVLLRG